MGLCIRIENDKGEGPYHWADPDQWPNKGASMVRHPPPYADFGHGGYDQGIFGFPNWKAMARWFHYIERLRIKRTHSEVEWYVAFYRTAQVYAQSERQMSFQGICLERLPINASGLRIARKEKELARRNV